MGFRLLYCFFGKVFGEDSSLQVIFSFGRPLRVTGAGFFLFLPLRLSPLPLVHIRYIFHSFFFASIFIFLFIYIKISQYLSYQCLCWCGRRPTIIFKRLNKNDNPTKYHPPHIDQSLTGLYISIRVFPFHYSKYTPHISFLRFWVFCIPSYPNN